MSTFVSVGNAKQPFKRLLEAVQENAGILPKPVVVQFGHNRFEDPRFECVEFLQMDAFQQQVVGSCPLRPALARGIRRRPGTGVDSITVSA